MDAFQRYDIESLTALLHEDATQSMPPYDLGLRGRDDILRWPGRAPAAAARARADGRQRPPRVGQYRPSGPGGAHEPWALQILEIEDGGVVEFSFSWTRRASSRSSGCRRRRPSARRADVGHGRPRRPRARHAAGRQGGLG